MQFHPKTELKHEMDVFLKDIFTTPHDSSNKSALKLRLCFSVVLVLAAELNCGTNHVEQLDCTQVSSGHTSIYMFDVMY